MFMCIGIRLVSEYAVVLLAWCAYTVMFVAHVESHSLTSVAHVHVIWKVVHHTWVVVRG